MPVQILSTKLSIPPLRSRLVNRSRLFQKLDQGMACGFVLISAPAGYGKTTLLSDWLNQVDYESAWLSLDDRDNDPTRFLSYLSAGLSKFDSSFEEVLGGALRLHPQPEIETLLTPLINQLAQAERPLCMVLDDYHVIQDQAVHQVLSFLLEHRPSTLHIFIVTRADPPLPLARLRSRSKMVEIRLADLRFSSQEISEFLSKGMGLNISEADLAILEASTEGWIAGLQMAGLSLQGREDVSSFIHSFSGENRYILDFLFDEVFQRQSSELRDFLLQTSILERLCGSLCNAVTRQENSQDILETMERINLFLISLDDQRKWYRYHHLFGDLLKSRLKQTLPDLSVLLHQRASTWYAAEQDFENAITHALAAKDFEHAANLIEQVAQTLDQQNQQAMLTSWLDRLPREILDTRPWLCVYRAWGCYWTGRREMEEEWLQTAEKSIDQTFETGDPERQHIQGHIATVRAMHALVDEDIPRALEMGQKALDLLPVGDGMRYEAAVALGSVHWARGDVIQSEKAFGMARSAVLKDSYASMAVGPTGYVGIQQVKQGHLQDAIVTFHEALRMATLPDGSQTPIAGFPNIRLGDVWRERNDLALASQYLLRGVDQCIRFNQPDVLADAYVCFGHYQLAVGDLEGTFETLRKADRIAQQIKLDQWILCWLDDCRLKAWLGTGDLDSASLWIQTSGLEVDGPLSYHHDLHHQNLARVLVAQSTLTGSRSAHEKASSLLARLWIAAEQAGWVHEGIKILVLQAVNFQSQGMGETALQSLAGAVSLGEPGGYVRVFVDEGESMRGLLILLENILQNGEQFVINNLGIKLQDEQLDRIKTYLSMILAAFDNPDGQIMLKGSASTLAGRVGMKPIKQLGLSNMLVESLSEREMEVLRLLAQGYSDKKIAETLVIARETVHKHLKNIYGKLGVHSRTEAVARARELSLL